ncbi:MAG: hypothetical protein LUG24_07800 [Clostridiales bacterium]|nr:hypothetical protein [Clostridiales bacterium]
MNFIKRFLSGNIMLKTGIAAGIIAAVVCGVCFGLYTVRAMEEQRLLAEGEELFAEDLSEEYYLELRKRFLNNNGETYEHYKMTEGISISFYGDSGAIDSASNYTLPALVSLNFLERFIYIMGNEGETPEDLASKQGGVPMYAQPFTIPEGQESVEITLINEYGTVLVPTLTNNGGLNPCVIAGVEGNISVDEEGRTCFTRAEDGDRVTTEKDTVVTTRAMKNRKEDIVVVFLQELPEGYSAERYVEILEKMRDYQSLKTGDKCFYVISPVLNTDSEKVAELDGLLEEHFGNYYINAREYLCQEAIEKYDIRVKDEEDVEAVEKGQVCSRFLTKSGKLNIYALYAISELFTETINENDSEILELRFDYEEEE